MGESERVRCRKCRRILLSKDELCVLDAHGEEYHDTVENNDEKSDELCPSIQEHSCLYLSEESYPDFVLSAVNESSWTKGKLHCPGCQARVGSFNFVSGSRCGCGVAVLPQVHILRVKVDWMKVSEVLPRPISYPDNFASESPPSLPLLTTNVEDNGDATSNRDPIYSLSETRKCSRKKRMNSRRLEENRCTQDQEMQGDSEGIRTHGDLEVLLSDSSEDYCILSATETPITSPATSTSTSVSKRTSTSISPHKSTSPSYDLSVPTTKTGMKSCLFELLDDEVSSGEERSSDEDKYDDIPIPDSLICVICLDMLYSPLVTQPCRHTFCEPCLRRLARPNPTQTCCPLCRRVIGHCMPAPEVGSEAREMFPQIYQRRRQFELQHNSHHMPLPWMRNFRFSEMNESGQNWMESARGWKTMGMMILLNVLGMGLLLYLGRPVKMEQDPHLYPASTFSLHHP